MPRVAAKDPTRVLILEWRPWTGRRGGFARIRLPSGMILNGVSVNVGADGQLWAGPPAKQQLDRNGQVIRDQNGKARWQPVVEFASRKVRDIWSDQVIAALRAAYPGVLADEGGAD